MRITRPACDRDQRPFEMIRVSGGAALPLEAIQAQEAEGHRGGYKSAPVSHIREPNLYARRK